MEYEKEYLLFQIGESAKLELRNRYLPEEKPIESIFQILYEPSFENHESWEVYRSMDANGEEYFFVIKSVWDKDNDSKKLEIPLLPLKIKHNKVDLTPTISRLKVKLESNYITNMRPTLDEIRTYPMIGQGRVGLDGATYHLKVGSGYDTCVFEWGENGPDKWRTLVSFVTQTLEELRKITNINNYA